MVVNKFQSESRVGVENSPPRLDSPHSFSDQSLATSLESVLLGFIIRKQLTEHDIDSLNLHFAGQDHLMIVTDNRCIYPIGDNKGECSLCVVIKDDQLNVCDLLSSHTELVDIIEDTWPSLLDASAKIKNSFDKCSGGLLVSRLSGRVIAASKNLAALTGIDQSYFEGKEYSHISRKFTPHITGKKLTIENFNAGGVCLSQVLIGSPTTANKNFESSSSEGHDSAVGTHQLIEEPDTVGLHFDRFNSLLGARLEKAMTPDTVTQIEAVVSALVSHGPSFNSSSTKAGLRLLILSILMAHSSIAGGTSRTEIKLKKDKFDKEFFEFETPMAPNRTSATKENEWFKTAGELAGKVGINIGDFEIKKKSVINRIELAKERI